MYVMCAVKISGRCRSASHTLMSAAPRFFGIRPAVLPIPRGGLAVEEGRRAGLATLPTHEAAPRLFPDTPAEHRFYMAAIWQCHRGCHSCATSLVLGAAPCSLGLGPSFWILSDAVEFYGRARAPDCVHIKCADL